LASRRVGHEVRGHFALKECEQRIHPNYQLQLSQEALKIDLHVPAEINYALMTTSYHTRSDRPAIREGV
jgi:hypothetical protein